MLLFQYGRRGVRNRFGRPRTDGHCQGRTDVHAKSKLSVSRVRAHVFRIIVDDDDLSVNDLQEEELNGAILTILANKQDVEGCMNVTEIHQALGLDTLKNRTFQIFKTSAKKGIGLDEAMDWLCNTLQNHK